jgi:hypothetical protein
MVDFYPYLIASLPMLHFGMKPPFSFERFLEICGQFVPEKDFQLLRTLPLPEKYSDEGKRHEIIQKWIQFDIALRNEVVKIRAHRKQAEPGMYLRSERYSGPSLVQVVTAAHMGASVLAMENSLDEARWRMLDELATGHYFDLDVLILYAYKLIILQRWENIRSADGKILLEKALQH